jgi:hypothetical protein
MDYAITLLKMDKLMQTGIYIARMCVDYTPKEAKESSNTNHNTRKGETIHCHSCRAYEQRKWGKKMVDINSTLPPPPLAPQPPPQNPAEFLEASQQFSFLQGGVVRPMPNPHPGGPGLCIYIPQRQGGPVIPLGTGYPF